MTELDKLNKALAQAKLCTIGNRDEYYKESSNENFSNCQKAWADVEKCQKAIINYLLQNK